MSQPEKWWWGFLPLVLLWILINLFINGSVETDLTSRSKGALGSLLMNPVVSASGRDITLTGLAFSPADAQTAATKVDNVWGVRQVANLVQTPPIAKPYDWQIVKDGNDITLSGYVPNAVTKTRILEAMSKHFGQAAIKDQLNYGSGAPESFEKGALFAIGQLAELTEGKAVLKDDNFFISGKAPTNAVYDAVVKAVHTPPPGVSLVKAEIIAPLQYIFNVTRLDEKLTLTGNVPSEDIHRKILADAKTAFFGEDIVDQLHVRGNAPTGFSEALFAGLTALARLTNGVLTITNTDVKLSGEALYERAVPAIRAELEKHLPADFKVDTSAITVRTQEAGIDTGTCQAELNRLLGKSTILFETNEAIISATSEGLLDRIVTIIQRCPNGTINISGHTDSTGDESFNLALSDKRARAVFDYLIAAGVPADRLSATGYGSSRPVASNETEEGRAQNRRIEFTVE